MLWTASIKLDKHCFRTVSKISKVAGYIIIHCQDHAANKLMLFCPMLYYNLVFLTFNSGPVFEPMTVKPRDLLQKLLHSVPKKLLNKYSWGIKCTSKFPAAYIFPKHKKQWTNARPIIAYSGTI